MAFLPWAEPYRLGRRRTTRCKQIASFSSRQNIEVEDTAKAMFAPALNPESEMQSRPNRLAAIGPDPEDQNRRFILSELTDNSIRLDMRDLANRLGFRCGLSLLCHL